MCAKQAHNKRQGRRNKRSDALRAHDINSVRISVDDDSNSKTPRQVTQEPAKKTQETSQ